MGFVWVLRNQIENGKNLCIGSVLDQTIGIWVSLSSFSVYHLIHLWSFYFPTFQVVAIFTLFWPLQAAIFTLFLESLFCLFFWGVSNWVEMRRGEVHSLSINLLIVLLLYLCEYSWLICWIISGFLLFAWYVGFLLIALIFTLCSVQGFGEMGFVVVVDPHYCDFRI